MSNILDKVEDEIERLQKEIRDLSAIVDPINRLRYEEGHSVLILCDNSDGEPNCAVEACGDWTGWVDKRFGGNTLAEALSNACKEMELASDAAKHAKRIKR